MKHGVFDLFPRIETPRLLLRKMRAKDVDALYALFSDPQVSRYYDLATFQSRDEAKQLIESFLQRYARRIGLRWAIAHKDTPDQLIGTCGYNIWFQEAHRAVLGYDLLPAHWRQGIMGEALSAVLDLGFSSMQLHRVEALTFPENIASRRLLDRLGFGEEGVLRDYQYLHGRYQSMAIYALLAQERPGCSV
ncbi:MAG: GNAT family N-acetyltransferase [Candidatus Latescibacterota bacterium]|jgi:ribosomal-protein-alanine N-acetyltransferase